jgi:HrpA-like RNA helicase
MNYIVTSSKASSDTTVPYHRTVTALPIDGLLPRILEALRMNSNLIIEAAPGAGKTTRVPGALLPLQTREILVLEPRRLAARLAARRVATELGESLGRTVGYQVRFEEVGGPETRIRFLTEGVFTRRLLSDPMLAKIGIVISTSSTNATSIPILRWLSCGDCSGPRVPTCGSS